MTDRQAKIYKLRKFLCRPSHNGGVFLISGQRGVGKTWVMNEALNDNPREPNWRDCLSGRIGRRQRFADIREPRGLRRVFLKVDVDPMLPIDSPDANADNGDEYNRYTRLLLLNICFALTNTIDSRFSIREHGRVLRERLGFFQYWFGDGLLWPGLEDRGILYRVCALMSVLQCSVWYVVKIWSEGSCSASGLGTTFAVTLLPWVGVSLLRQSGLKVLLFGQALVWGLLEYPIYRGSPCWLHLLTAMLVLAPPVVAWMALRWLDWRALQKVSAQLYDLAHANQYHEDRDQTRDRQRESRINLSWILSVLLVLTTAIWLIPGEEFSAIYHSAFANLFSATPQAFQNLLQLLFPVILIATLIYSRFDKSHDGQHTKFDKSNVAWLINLLRRYLFLCHRCGLEPVLVLDELDKLDGLDTFAGKTDIANNEESPTQKWQIRSYISDSQPAAERPPLSSNDREIYSLEHFKEKPPKPNHLNSFLIALSRLKGSLGSEFLWVLIGGHTLHNQLQQHRHEREDGNLGLLATVIHQEDILGPMSWLEAKQYLRDESQNKREGINAAHRRILWLRSYGNFSTLIRECENIRRAFTFTSFELRLTFEIRSIWSIEAINELLSFHNNEVLDEVKDERIYIWIRSGILDAGNRLIKTPLPNRDFFINDEATVTLAELHAIRAVEPTLLRAAGARLLYKHLKLKRLIEDVGKDKIKING